MSMNSLLAQCSKKQLRPALRRFASEANADVLRQHHNDYPDSLDDAFLQELTHPSSSTKHSSSSQATARPRPASVADSRRESRSVFEGLRDILRQPPHSTSSSSSNSNNRSDQLLSAVLDLDHFPGQRKLAEKAIRRHTFESLDNELDQVQEDLAGLYDEHALWTYASSRIVNADVESIASDIYPQMVQLLFDHLPQSLQLPFFHLVATSSTESFVYGCTSQLFAKVAKLQWHAQADIQAVHDTLQSMLNASIPLNWHIRDLVHEISLAVEADAQKATEETVEALAHMPPPPSSFSSGADVDQGAEIQARALALRRFSQADHEALAAMQEWLAAEPIAGDAVEQEDASAVQTTVAPRRSSSSSQSQNVRSFRTSQDAATNEGSSEAPTTATVAFDDWLRQAEKIHHEQQQQQQQRSGAQRSQQAQHAPVYLHPIRRSMTSA